MPAASAFTLVLLTLATSLLTVSAFRESPDRSGDARVRWVVLYLLAVVVPWATTLYYGRAGARHPPAAAIVATGHVVLLASLGVVTPRPPVPWPLMAAALGASAAVLLGAAFVFRRFR
jgi:hypothetical protein